jgi:hypothetical protein
MRTVCPATGIFANVRHSAIKAAPHKVVGSLNVLSFRDCAAKTGAQTETLTAIRALNRVTLWETRATIRKGALS